MGSSACSSCINQSWAEWSTAASMKLRCQVTDTWLTMAGSGSELPQPLHRLLRLVLQSSKLVQTKRGLQESSNIKAQIPVISWGSHPHCLPQASSRHSPRSPSHTNAWQTHCWRWVRLATMLSSMLHMSVVPLPGQPCPACIGEVSGASRSMPSPVVNANSLML